MGTETPRAGLSLLLSLLQSYAKEIREGCVRGYALSVKRWFVQAEKYVKAHGAVQLRQSKDGGGGGGGGGGAEEEGDGKKMSGRVVSTSETCVAFVMGVCVFITSIDIRLTDEKTSRLASG